MPGGENWDSRKAASYPANKTDPVAASLPNHSRGYLNTPVNAIPQKNPLNHTGPRQNHDPHISGSPPPNPTEATDHPPAGQGSQPVGPPELQKADPAVTRTAASAKPASPISVLVTPEPLLPGKPPHPIIHHGKNPTHPEALRDYPQSTIRPAAKAITAAPGPRTFPDTDQAIHQPEIIPVTRADRLPGPPHPAFTGPVPNHPIEPPAVPPVGIPRAAGATVHPILPGVHHLDPIPVPGHPYHDPIPAHGRHLPVQNPLHPGHPPVQAEKNTEPNLFK